MNFVLDLIAKPTIILLLAALVSILMRRSSASFRHAVWLLAMTAAVALPLVSMTIPRIEVPISSEPSASVTFLPSDEAAQTVGNAERGLKPSTTYLPERSGPGLVGWVQLLRLVWFSGICLLLMRLMMGSLAVGRMARTAALGRDDSWRALVTDLCADFRIRRPVRLLFSETQVSPMTWGVLRHAILLPSSAVEWSDERRRLVLAHELAHVKRNDGIVQIFVQVVCSIYWFNPLIWYAAYRVRMERERACDDHVLRLGTAAADYADHLVQIVRGFRTRRVLSFAAVSMAQRSQLETRLVSILDSGAPRRALSKAGASALCAIVSVVTFSLAAVGIAAAVELPPVVVSVMKFVPPAPAPKPAAKPPAVPQGTRIGNGDSAPIAVIPPAVVESMPPLYTEEAMASYIEGIVTLEVAVDVEGKVTILRMIKGLGYGLDEKARKSVMEWKFAPATRNGLPVEAIAQVDVLFELPVWLNPPQDDMPPIKIGPGVTPPTVSFRVEPQYTPEAREARIRGTVVLSAVVHQDGRLTVNDVIQELEMGLTGRAIEAVELWKFKPAMRDGKAVPVSLKVEVNFNLK